MPFRILVLGDSVAWGQGLKDTERFSTIVASQIGRMLGLKPRTSVAVSFAHSGAIIGTGAEAWPRDDRSRMEKAWIYGEVPKGEPSLLTQLEMSRGGAAGRRYAGYLEGATWDTAAQKVIKDAQRAHAAEFAGNSPELILVSGGINDFNARNLIIPFTVDDMDVIRKMQTRELLARFNPLTDREELERMIDESCNLRLAALLQRIRALYPEAPVIVTGYYPLFTEGLGKLHRLGAVNRALRSLAPAIGAAFKDERTCLPAAAVLFGALGWEWFVTRSADWVELSTRAMNRAIARVDGEQGTIHFANPAFGPGTGVGCRDSWLFFGKPDPAKTQRMAAFDRWKRYRGAWDGWKAQRATCQHASWFHPNPKGSRAYGKAILGVLERHPELLREAVG